LHHRGEFSSGLARIERHGDDAFGHQCEIKNRPTNRVGREKSAPVSRLKASLSQVRSHSANLRQQFRTGNIHKFSISHFAQHNPRAGTLQLRKNSF